MLLVPLRFLKNGEVSVYEKLAKASVSIIDGEIELQVMQNSLVRKLRIA